MSDIGDAIGTVAEGALVSKAVEDEKGTPLVKGHFAEGECLNCGTELIGSHCHNCGQKVHLHRTIGAFMHDLLHGALHLEGKTWRTLPKLVFKPGELTRRYIAGERARFVSPMALFLFVIFLMFAVFQIAGISAPTDIDPKITTDVREVTEAEIERLETDIAQLDEDMAAGELEDGDQARAAAKRDSLANELAGLRAARQFLPGVEDSEEPTKREVVAGVPMDRSKDGSTNIPLSVDGDSSWYLNIEENPLINGAVEKWRKNPSLMVYKLQTNFYKFSWLLIPLSIPFVWLLFFWKRRFKAYDHAIFVTYSLSFMTMLILALVLLGLGGAHPLILILGSTVIPVLHLYKQLRGAYRLSRFSTLWRLAALSLFITFILTIFMNLLLLLGAF